MQLPPAKQKVPVPVLPMVAAVAFLLCLVGGIIWMGVRRPAESDWRAQQFLKALESATAIEVVDYPTREPAPDVTAITGNSLDDLNRNAGVLYIRDMTGGGLSSDSYVRLRIRCYQQTTAEFTWFGDAIVVGDETRQTYMQIIRA